jgi:hypothetical protein
MMEPPLTAREPKGVRRNETPLSSQPRREKDFEAEEGEEDSEWVSEKPAAGRV